MAAVAHERQKLERLCRYIIRPAIAEQRLSRTAQGMGTLPAQDPVPIRHHACGARTTGFHCPPGGSGSQTPGEPHPLPRCVRAQQPTDVQQPDDGRIALADFAVAAGRFAVPAHHRDVANPRQVVRTQPLQIERGLCDRA